MGFGSFLKNIVKVALPVAGAAIGGAVGGPVGASIGGSLGGAIAGGGGQQQGGQGGASTLGGIIGGISNNQALNDAQKIAQQTADKQLSILERQYNLTRGDLLKAVSDGKIVLDDTTKQAIQTLNKGFSNASTYNNQTLDKIIDRLTPYMSAGDMAFMQQNDLLGINGQKAQERAYGFMEKNPQFQTLMKQSENALLQNASATGGLRGGNTQSALAKLRPQLLNQIVQQQLGNLNSVANTGLNTSQNLANTQTAFAGQNQNLQTGLASAVGGLQANLGINQANLGLKAPVAMGVINQGYGENVSKVLGDLGQVKYDNSILKNQNTQQIAGGASSAIEGILGSVLGGGQGGQSGGMGNILGSIGGLLGGGGGSQVPIGTIFGGSPAPVSVGGGGVGFGSNGLSGFGF
jgi:hypothetical protein